MNGDKKSVYWDSSAFLAYLKQEQGHGPDALPVLSRQAEAFDRREIIIMTSTVGLLEVHTANMTDEEREKFDRMAERSNFLPITVTGEIARLAAHLRRHCYGREKNGAGEPHVLATPDAIHVASAMKADADVLITLDTKNKLVKAERREMGMTQVRNHLPGPGLPLIEISAPTNGLPGTGLFQEQ
jgi:predicted nucleic acid-binding protein